MYIYIYIYMYIYIYKLLLKTSPRESFRILIAHFTINKTKKLNETKR